MIKAREKNNTWELTNLPKGQKSIGVKQVYKPKLNADGNVGKYKARLVVKGYKQEYGVDYKEVFATVDRHDTIDWLFQSQLNKICGLFAVFYPVIFNFLQFFISICGFNLNQFEYEHK